MSGCNLQAPTNGFLIYKPSKASASIIHLYCERVLPARARRYRKIYGIPESAGFSEDRTGGSAQSPTRTSAVKPVIGVPSQRGGGEDAHAAERFVLLLIFQNQHGRRGTASGARGE